MIGPVTMILDHSRDNITERAQESSLREDQWFATNSLHRITNNLLDKSPLLVDRRTNQAH